MTMPLQQPPSLLGDVEELKRPMLSPEVEQRLRDDAVRRYEQSKKDRKIASITRKLRKKLFG
jgi:hypothetical protein